MKTRTCFVLFRSKPKEGKFGLSRVFTFIDIKTGEVCEAWIFQEAFEPKDNIQDVYDEKIMWQQYNDSAMFHLPLFYDIVKIEYKEDVDWNFIELDYKRLNDHREWLLCRKALQLNKKIKLKGITYIEKIQHLSVPQQRNIFLQECTFGKGFIVENKSGLVIAQPADGSIAFDYVMNELQPIRGMISVKGNTYVFLKANVAERRFYDVYQPVDGTSFEITGYDFQDLNAKLDKYKIDKAYWMLVKEIRDRLKEGKFMTEWEVTELASKLNIKVNAKKVLQDETIEAGYRPEYIWWLDDHKTGTALYGSGGNFFFDMNRFWVWEDPRDGKATYIFNKQLRINELATKAVKTPRTVIMAEPDLLGYVKRVIHPYKSDDEEVNRRLFHQWVLRLKSIVEAKA